MISTRQKQGTIAFITTPKFRTSSPELTDAFVFRHLYTLANAFTVMTTGRTFELMERLVAATPTAAAVKLIEADMKLANFAAGDLERWRTTILGALKPTMPGYPGMIHVAYELVEGRLDAVIHLSDWEDKTGKPDSAVLSREANVHDVPIAADPDTAKAYIASWEASLARLQPGQTLFKKRQQPKAPPLKDLKPGHRVLAMVAHDNMKLEICRFAVEYATHIFRSYDYVLATGTTGNWLRRFMEAIGRGRDDIKKIRLCNSGPLGGDIQIAFAVVKEICRKIIFLQDPSVSHPHDSDIRLFEQAVLKPDIHVELATNVESARLLIGA